MYVCAEAGIMYVLFVQVNGNSDVVNLLLDNGADINQRDDNGISVLSACHHVLFSSHSKVRQKKS